jgi:uncharacterized RDD family membrane protein YckC
MEWYYVVDGQRLGPVSDEQLNALIENGTVGGTTLVWRQGMPDWRTLQEVRARHDAMETSADSTTWCEMCGRRVAADETLALQGHRVCSQCKPVAVERVREGLDVVQSFHGSMAYAGFWIRFAAKFIDGIILSVFNNIVLALFGLQTGPHVSSSDDVGVLMTAVLLANLIVVVGNCVYSTLFVGTYGGTPGKLLCGLRIVQPDGSKVSYMRAFGRFWAESLSALILFIGYIMAAFDDEKRTLHDRLASTRVVHKTRR